jgi:hypothetical protein
MAPLNGSLGRWWRSRREANQASRYGDADWAAAWDALPTAP